MIERDIKTSGVHSELFRGPVIEGITCNDEGLTAFVLDTVSDLDKAGVFAHPVDAHHNYNVRKSIIDKREIQKRRGGSEIWPWERIGCQ